jgi:hypothetical protein
VDAQPQQSVDRLVAEINLARQDRSQGEWSSNHPRVELQFSNLKTDLRLNEASPEARELFGVENQMETHQFMSMLGLLRARMDEVQCKAYLREQSEILARIQADSAGFAAAEDQPQALPLARVPVIFKNDSAKPDEKPQGHLPVLVRYSFDHGLIKLRILFIPVSESLRKDPAGHWVCGV